MLLTKNGEDTKMPFITTPPVNLNNSLPMDDFQFSPVPYSQQENECQRENSGEIVTGHPKRIIRPPDKLTL